MIYPPSKAKKLKDACRTRWIQRIDSHRRRKHGAPGAGAPLKIKAYKKKLARISSLSLRDPHI